MTDERKIEKMSSAIEVYIFQRLYTALGRRAMDLEGFGAIAKRASAQIHRDLIAHFDETRRDHH